MRPPLLFIHGAFGQAAHFEPWLDYFRQAGFRGKAISLPGHGPSDPVALTRLRLGDYLVAAGEAVRSLGTPPVVIGHSLGGLIALMLAAEGECAGAVLVAAPAPGLPPARPNAFRFTVPFVTRVLAGLPVPLNPAAMRLLATHDLSAAESDEIVAQSGMESGLVLRKVAFANTAVDYEAIRCPLLCLSGGADRIVPDYAARRIVAATKAEHITFPGHGHWLIAGSLTGIVAAAVKSWLERHFGRDAG
jgi:pimeloyl-ACP methyl ester carboxylesterase